MIILDYIDPEDIKKLHDNSFPIPDLSKCIAGRTIIDNGGISAIALLRVTSEAILFTNQNLPNITRGRALQALMKELEKELKYRNLTDCHIFVKNENAQKTLKHVGFIDR